MNRMTKMNNEKAVIRKEIKEFFASDAGKKIIEREKLRQKSEVYCKNFLERIPNYRNVKSVFAYCPLKAEFPTEGLLRQAYKDGKLIAVPLVLGKDLVFKKVEFVDGELYPLQKGSFDVLEPTEEAEIIYPGAAQLELPLLILVPGRAFSENGARLGWGGGFYDRFFEKLFYTVEKDAVSLVGLSFLKQLRNDIPVDKFDCKVDLVLSEMC